MTDTVKCPRTLQTETLLEGVTWLTQQDPDLAEVVTQFGPPPMWAREPGFATLIHIILEQQVSLASAKAAFDRLLAAAGELTPERFLTYADHELKGFGFSRQKSRYGRELAQAILRGDLNLEQLPQLDDFAVRAALTSVTGIGPWTAEIYLLMVLRRPDVWPVGDLALAVAVKELKGLAQRPGPDELERIARPWQPWRAVAARILWHHYLSRPR